MLPLKISTELTIHGVGEELELDEWAWRSKMEEEKRVEEWDA